MTPCPCVCERQTVKAAIERIRCFIGFLGQVVEVAVIIVWISNGKLIANVPDKILEPIHWQYWSG